ncbi:MAG: choice-of-anchor J domain-containing protein [Crocinitomicaceae bacterium]|nr:choice-of-anchor J domain-containing protein [Crocinitomicaceae bacterium]
MIKGLIFGAFAFVSFTATSQTEIFNEDFQTGAPTAFTIVDNDGFTPNAATAQFTEAWTRLPDPLDTADTVMGSTSYFEPVGTADRWLITPAIALSSFGNFFYWEARSHDPSFPDDYKVLVSTTDTQLASFTDTIALIEEEFGSWFQREVDLSALGYDNETIHVAFVNTTNDGFALYVDDIRAVIEDPVGINELAEVAVQVYPNPVSDVMKVQSEAIVQSLELIALNGSVLKSSDSNEINVSSLLRGSYFVKVVTDQGMVVRSFVKM